MTEPATEVIRTPRLELVLMSVSFMEALAKQDLGTASDEIEASVPEWIAFELENFVNLRLGQLRVDPTIHEWLGRAMG